MPKSPKGVSAATPLDERPALLEALNAARDIGAGLADDAASVLLINQRARGVRRDAEDGVRIAMRAGHYRR